MNRDQQTGDERPLCPKCGSPDVRRSHQDGLPAAILRILGRWPFRCRSCRARFYRSSPPPEES